MSKAAILVLRNLKRFSNSSDFGSKDIINILDQVYVFVSKINEFSISNKDYIISNCIEITNKIIIQNHSLFMSKKDVVVFTSLKQLISALISKDTPSVFGDPKSLTGIFNHILENENLEPLIEPMLKKILGYSSTLSDINPLAPDFRLPELIYVFRKIMPQLSNEVAKKFEKVVQGILKKIAENNPHYFNINNVPCLHFKKYDVLTEYREFLINLSLDILKKTSLQKNKKLCDRFSKTTTQILSRLALVEIRDNFAEYKSEFLKLIQQPNLLNSEFCPELCEIFQMQENFSEEEINLLISIDNLSKPPLSICIYKNFDKSKLIETKLQPLSSNKITRSNNRVVSKAKQSLPMEKEIALENIETSAFSKLETKLKEELKINKYDSSPNLNKYVYEHTQEFLENLNKSKLLQHEKIMEWTLKELGLLINDLAFTSTTVETIFEYVKKIAKPVNNSYTVAYRIASILSKIAQSYDFNLFLCKTKIYETLISYFKQYIDDKSIAPSDYIGEFGAISQFSIPGICYSGIVGILENKYLFSEEETKKQFTQIITLIKDRNINRKYVSPSILIEFGKNFTATFNFATNVSKNFCRKLNDNEKHLVLSGYFISPIVDKNVYNFLFQYLNKLSITDLKYEILKRGYITKLICYIIHFTKSSKNVKYEFLKKLLEHELYIYKFSFHYLVHQLHYTKNNRKNATYIWQTLGESSNENTKNKEEIQLFFKEQFKTEPKLSQNGALAFIRSIQVITEILDPVNIDLDRIIAFTKTIQARKKNIDAMNIGSMDISILPSLLGKTKRSELSPSTQHFANFRPHLDQLRIMRSLRKEEQFSAQEIAPLTHQMQKDRSLSERIQRQTDARKQANSALRSDILYAQS